VSAAGFEPATHALKESLKKEPKPPTPVNIKESGIVVSVACVTALLLALGLRIMSANESISEMNAAVAIYNNHVDAEGAVKEFQKSGFDMKKLSIVGKDYHTDEHAQAIC
jgi:hypothetical protein